MNTTTHLDAILAFIFIGVFQGLILSFFFIIKSSSNIKANLYQGLLHLSLTLCILEQFLNLTGYITRVLPITNYSEPLNFNNIPVEDSFVTGAISFEDYFSMGYSTFQKVMTFSIGYSGGEIQVQKVKDFLNSFKSELESVR